MAWAAVYKWFRHLTWAGGHWGAGIAQLVQRWAGWLRFDSWQGQEILLYSTVGSGAHPPSYPVGTRGKFHGGKVTGACS
jgi:hypothetical protein